ncbi:THAP domain-containing protein 5-like [Phymastichus coffea]|uniref:THAP domain-containing protein 5-like n=1 Tax=Phymastichus coffea TaxID=108790 RepID=UPI00273CCF6E|nr:THAP domain-containing protein 5-like [Phymastichus coffea]XP_058801458.1 THAP domain-containing protein 5-like [Phymastichus coffea]XP_058801459.1 THAP domain-containing protein 5-like [Phymastichus coffea]
MPICCVPNCNNSTESGFLLRCFPRNNSLRAEWARNINKSGWIPNHCHRICEVHFEPNMWEKTRVDGTRKLKHKAVPTIFNDHIIEEASPTTIIIPPVEDNKTEVEVNEKPIIKILPPANSKNTKPIILPASIFENQSNPPSTIIVNTEGKIINTQPVPSVPKRASILKSQIKSVTAPSASVVIATNASSSILKSQIQNASNQSPIVIPANGSILKPQFQITAQQISTQLPNIIHSKNTNNQSILIPLNSSAQELSNNTSNVQLISSTVSSATVLDTNIKDDLEEMFEEYNDNNVNTVPANTSLSQAKMKKIADERFEKMDKLLLKQLKLNNALRKKLHAVNHQLHQQTKVKDNDFKEYLKDLFTDDQIRAIELRHTNPRSITAWSHKTMIKALKLKECCGTRGYEELLKQNMPLPSIRTISRWCTQRNLPIP